MDVLRTVAEARAWRAKAGTVGLVPTMGALHTGHLSLVKRALRENEAVAASIFVNPLQFAPREDFARYPRREADDLAALQGAGAAAAFVPSVEEMYPAGEDTRVTPGAIAGPLEGKARPGHFTGVATVVAKLFAIIRPDRAYFGQKDFQQLRVIQRIVRDLRLGVRVVPCETVRTRDGLALSSRNDYLSAADRTRATALSAGLFAARLRFSAGERHADALLSAARAPLERAGIVPEYLALSDPLTLAELEGEVTRAVISVAARVGTARLIDNVLLGMKLGELEELG